MKLAKTGLGLVARSGCLLAFPHLARRIGRLVFARTYNRRSRLRSSLMPMRRTKPGEPSKSAHQRGEESEHGILA